MKFPWTNRRISQQATKKLGSVYKIVLGVLTDTVTHGLQSQLETVGQVPLWYGTESNHIDMRYVGAYQFGTSLLF